ncbi:MAG: type II toxin-antitoxin system RelE/ParE family toxin [Candidatus Adiutrix sp.]|jgi:mRNA interferase RelE/StbE|nr:type II toxin-antitoxin system RelE/ParE family toxin [Candidatus Adiutrix sp.]
MTWNIELSPEARKDLAKLGATEAKRILKFLHQRLRPMENPRDAGKALVGPTLAGLWRYRAGDYRILRRIEDEKICIVVVKIGNRREIYK